MPKNPDFSNILTIQCCYGDSRINDAYASASAALINTRNSHHILCFNNDSPSENSIERKTLLEALAQATGNTFTWLAFPQAMSKAAMIANVLQKNSDSREWYLNLDDDFLTPYHTLDLLATASVLDDITANMYAYGQYDIINYRDYQDWDSTVLKIRDVLTFARDNGIRCLPNHLCETVDTFTTFEMPGQSTGAYMIRRSSIPNETIQKMVDWPKGKRGYDDLLCNSVTGVHWIFGSNSYHTDRTKVHVDGVIWNQDVFRDDLMLSGETLGRPVVGLDEKSLPRTSNNA